MFGKISQTRTQKVSNGGEKMEKYGDPDGGIAPGTAFEDLPDDWLCPICGMGKEVFAKED